MISFFLKKLDSLSLIHDVYNALQNQIWICVNIYKLLYHKAENGAPNDYCSSFALSKYNWSEMLEAKWDLQQIRGNLVLDIE